MSALYLTVGGSQVAAIVRENGEKRMKRVTGRVLQFRATHSTEYIRMRKLKSE